MAEQKKSEAKPATEEPKAEAPVAPEPVVEEDWATRFKYLLADFDNYRKRSDRERDSARRHSRAEVLREVIRLFETFERAREAADTLPPEHPLRRGLDLLSSDWQEFWRSEGIKPVAKEGEKFSAEDHEAVAESPADRETREGTIVEVVQQGYRSPGGLLRPAKVVVARAPASAKSTDEEGAAARVDGPDD